MFDGVVDAINVLAMGLAEATVNFATTTAGAIGSFETGAVSWLQEFGVLMLSSIADFNSTIISWIQSILLA